MTTNLTIIGDALRDINVIGEVDPVSPEQGAYCLRRLNQMMEVWKEQDIDLGWFAQTLTTATAPIPDWAELGVTNALSIAISPQYGASISIELAAVADISVGAIKRRTMVDLLQGQDMSHMPMGRARRRQNILTGQ